MPLSIYDASVPTYLHMLGNLAALLDKAESHAKANGIDLATYTDARLAPDMHSLKGQIQLASDAAKSGAARLAGQTPPSFPDTEATWDELKDRVAKTVAFVRTIRREDVEAREAETVELPLPSRTLTFTASDFLLRFSLPNFLFHVTTAYALLRAQGVPLGKLDYLAGAQGLPPG
jgi:uncharacterized protein